MSETVGQILQRVRRERGLTLEQAAQATRVRIHYLKALEDDNWAALPSSVQGRGFMRLYADYLGINTSELLDIQSGKVPTIENKVKKEIPAAPVLEEEESLPVEETPGSKEVAIQAPPEQIPDLPEQERSESQRIFEAIGEQLRRQRELLGLSLEEVERHTHVRQFTIKALESGRMDDLASPVYTRGMLSSYARFLNLDSEALMLRFADGLQTGRLERTKGKPGKKTTRRAPRVVTRTGVGRFISLDLVLGAMFIIGLVGFVVWGAMQVLALQNQPGITPTIPRAAEVLSASASPTAGTATATQSTQEATAPTATQSIATAQATLMVTMPSADEATIQVYVTIRQSAWMRISVDGQVAFNGRVTPGGAYAFAGKKTIELVTGNGAALQVFYNQNDLGTLGLAGQVVNLIFTSKSVVTPTPLFTLTPTKRLAGAATQAPTQTLTVTATK
jgi:cytoskeleton protein RodZ